MDNLTAPTSNEVHHCSRCRRPYRGEGITSIYSSEHKVCPTCGRNEKFEKQGVFPLCVTNYWDNSGK